MKKNLLRCGTVLHIDLTNEKFGNIVVDIAGVELRRLLEEFYSSLPDGEKKRIEKHIIPVLTLIQKRIDKFEVDISPVANIQNLKERNNYILPEE